MTAWRAHRHAVDAAASAYPAGAADARSPTTPAGASGTSSPGDSDDN
jgi:hypothetical protein